MFPFFSLFYFYFINFTPFPLNVFPKKHDLMSIHSPSASKNTTPCDKSTAPSPSATVSLLGMAESDQNAALLAMIADANALCDLMKC